MPTIRIRLLVFDDLSEIWSYIAKDNPNQADNFIDSIDIRRKLNELSIVAT